MARNTLRPLMPGERRANRDGSYSTELLTTWQLPDGRWVNVPSLWMGPDGPVQFDEGDEQGILGTMGALEAARGGGEQFRRYPSVEMAEDAARNKSNSGGVGNAMVGLLSGALMGPAQRLLQQAPAAQMAAPMQQQASGGGILSMINPNIGQNPLYQRFDRNRDVITNALLGGVGAESPLERMRGMAGGALKGRDTSRLLQMERAKQEKEQQRINATMQAFQKAGRTDLLQAVQGGMPMGEAWKSFLKGTGADGGATYSKTPVYGTDENGNPVLGTIGDDGSFKKIDTGDFNISTGVDKIDLGTQWGLLDRRSGQLVGSMPKDNFGEAFEKGKGAEVGKAEGEAIATYRSVMSKMPGLEAVVEKLDELSEKATYTLGGQAVDFAMKQAGMEPRDAAIARAEYIAIVDNQILPLLRDTFGAAFTAKEGDSLRATLGDPDKSPKEKQAVLKAFIEQKRRNIEALAQQAGQIPPPAAVQPPPASGGYRILGVE